MLARRWRIATAAGVVLFTTSVVLGGLQADRYVASTRILKRSADRDLRLRGVPGVLDDYTILDTAAKVVLSRPVIQGALDRLRERTKRLRGLSVVRDMAPRLSVWTEQEWETIRKAAGESLPGSGQASAHGSSPGAVPGAVPAVPPPHSAPGAPPDSAPDSPPGSAKEPGGDLAGRARRLIASLSPRECEEVSEITPEDSRWIGILSSLDGIEVQRIEGFAEEVVLESVGARVEENGDVLTITASDVSPRVAAALANAVSESFLDLNLKMLRSDAQDALRAGGELLAARQKEIQRLDQDIERRWLDRAEALHAAGLPGEGGSSDVLEALRAKHDEIDGASFELRRAEERIRALHGELPKVSDASLESILEQLKVKLADYRARYTPDNPLVQRVEGNVSYVEGLLGERRKQVVRGERLPETGIGASLSHSLILAEADRNALLAHVEELRSQRDAIAKADEGARRVDAEIARIEQQREGLRSIVKMIEMRRHEALLAEGAQSTPFFLLERAQPSAVPVSPQRLRIAIVAFLLAIVTAIAAAFLVEHLDASVRTFADVERHLGLPVLGVVPRWPRREGAVAKGDALSVASLEVFGLVRNHIRLSPLENAESCLLVTSALQGEGKTATCANLALSYALEGTRVAVVDLDLRRGKDHPLLRALPFQQGPDRGGLRALLSGQGNLDDVLARAETAPAVLLPAGPPMAHPARLFSTDTFAGILERLRRRYEVVLLDGPPVLPFTDVTVVSSLVRGVLLVVEWGRTPLASARRTKSRLEAARSPLLGVVLNKARALAREDLCYAYSLPAATLPPMDVLSGTQAMRLGLITQGQLFEALRLQDEAREQGLAPRAIGEILVDSGWVQPEEFERLLRELHGERQREAETEAAAPEPGEGEVG